MFAEDYKINRKISCLLLCAISIILSFEVSSSSFGLLDLFPLLKAKFFGQSLSKQQITTEKIMLSVRLPRILVAALCGASLGTAGVISQGLFRNPLASPSLTGSASGATLGAVLCFFFGLSDIHSLSVPIAAVLGALLSSILLFMLYTRENKLNLTKLLLIGLTFSTFTAAFSSLIISLESKDPYKSFAIYRWLMGGFHSVEWLHFQLILLPLGVGVIYAGGLAKEMDLMCLGDETAESLGVSIKNLKLKCILLLSVLLGFVTSIAGAIPFVGLIVPHITRNLLGSHHKDLLKYTFINSITLITLADLVAKKALAYKELELGIILSLMGSPFSFTLS